MAQFGRSKVLYMRGRIDEAAGACEQALARWPNEPHLLMRLGFYRLQQGRPEELEAPVRLAMRLDPMDTAQLAIGHFYLGMAAFHVGRDDEAYDEMRQAVTADPTYGFGWQWMAAIDALHGRDAPARDELARFRKLIPGHTVASLKASEPSRNPRFWAGRERLYEGLLKAGLPP